MSELVLTLLRYGFLVVLWLFILGVITTLRRDIYGVRVKKRGGGSQPVAPVNYGRAAPSRKQPKAGKNIPTKITVTAGPLTGTNIPLKEHAIIVGRSPDSAFVLDDSYSSSRHARFFKSEGHWYVEDMQSTNGTYVHGQRIDHPVLLKPGDTVVIGQTTFSLQR